ncbi:transcription factor HES-2.1 [Tachysurus fulvidraco]|uniref:transcription factor HES-2.1 n=1 Tax=Tachysurus fulvidraco TaxID=1234273 RepID=UPI000F4EEF90|nr:transcription factor HES-2.1 [Tachysurus fulvidraco]
MTPNIITDSTDSFSSRMTVAQRKEANELRKTLKPLMEKRRRARINDSLNNLKDLIVPLVGKDTSRYSKLEKADILEMTVRFLRELPSSPVKAQADSYREGYEACLLRVSALLPRTSLDHETCARVNDFIQQSKFSSSPACRTCSARTSSALSPVQHERLLSPKANNSVSRTENVRITGPTSSRVHAAPQATTQTMWRPW